MGKQVARVVSGLFCLTDFARSAETIVACARGELWRLWEITNSNGGISRIHVTSLTDWLLEVLGDGRKDGIISVDGITLDAL